jgi:peptidoglycan hydrolase CwlO-like protein
MADTAGTRDALRAHFEAIKTEVDELQAEVDTLREQRHTLLAERLLDQDAVAAIDEQIAGLERPRLVELKTEFANLARALGGRSMSDSTA